MATNEGVTNRSADDGTLDCGRIYAEYFGAADWRLIFVHGSYLYIIFSVLMTRSARGNIDDTKAVDKLKEI